MPNTSNIITGYPTDETEPKKQKELLVGKLVDEIRNAIRSRIKEKVIVKSGDYREYKPLTSTDFGHPYNQNKSEE